LDSIIGRCQAVLFDLDGVLSDSPAVHAWAWAEVFRPYGIELPPERLHREEGRKSEDIAQGIILEYGLSIPDLVLNEMLVNKRRMFRAAFKPGIRADAKRLLIHLRIKNYRTAMVSGSARENVMHALGEGEAEMFDVLITAEDYSAGKPNPEPYLTACRKLNIEPRNGLAVENAPLGIASALAAGLTVAAITSTLPAKELAEAHFIIKSLNELPAILFRT